MNIVTKREIIRPISREETSLELKDKGSDYFKDGKFLKAIECYKQAISKETEQK